MKRHIAPIAIALLLTAVTCAAEENGKQPVTNLETDSQKFSYVMGLDVATALKKGLRTRIDMAVFLKGVEDGFREKTPLLTPREAAEVKKRIADGERAAWEREAKEVAERNLAAGTAFLAENRKKSGIKTTASGLQYEILLQGNGPVPTADDRVSVQYRAMKIDGKEYDNSYNRNKPTVVPVNAVLPGWSEALQLMPVGSIYRIFLPPQLAYGERQAGPRGEVKANETLIFEVELLTIEPRETKDGTAAEK
ncbi:MAG: FKBP-type peptidyl-prolyl cis-trans isomerase N-terminal domain-containing protein [Thermodesulfobacteriota bacterium]